MSYQSQNKALMKRGVNSWENEASNVTTAGDKGGNFFDFASSVVNSSLDFIASMIGSFILILTVYLVVKAILNYKGKGASEAVASMNQDIQKVLGFFLNIFVLVKEKLFNTFSFLWKRKWATGALFILIFVFWATLQFDLVQVLRVKPGQKGVDIISGKVLEPGFYLVSPLKSHYIISHVANYQFDITEITADSKELQDVVIHLNVGFHLEEDSLVEFYRREGVISIWGVSDSIVMPKVTEKVKNIVKNYSFKEVIGQQIKIKEESQKEIAAALEPLGIKLDDLNIINIRISSDLVKILGERDVLDEKMEIAQKELKIAEQQKQKQIIEAEGIAESNKLISSQQITEQTLELKRIENARQGIEKWDGKVPQQVGGDFTLGQ